MTARFIKLGYLGPNPYTFRTVSEMMTFVDRMAISGTLTEKWAVTWGQFDKFDRKEYNTVCPEKKRPKCFCNTFYKTRAILIKFGSLHRFLSKFSVT